MIFDEPPVFLGIGRNGEHVATVRFEMEQAYDDDLNVLANISTTDALGRADNVNDIELRTGAGRRIRLDEETAERVQPEETVSALFSSGDANSLVDGPISEFRLRLHAARTACARTQVMWLRDRLLKLSVHVVSSVRRLVLHLPRSTPNLDAWRKIALSLGARAG